MKRKRRHSRFGQGGGLDLGHVEWQMALGQGEASRRLLIEWPGPGTGACGEGRDGDLAKMWASLALGSYVEAMREGELPRESVGRGEGSKTEPWETPAFKGQARKGPCMEPPPRSSREARGEPERNLTLEKASKRKGSAGSETRVLPRTGILKCPLNKVGKVADTVRACDRYLGVHHAALSTLTHI